jgi:carboxymethylenebutenolidase
MEAFSAIPTTGELHPGVLVIHEIFGLNENIREITLQFARQGYAALAIDLFSGRPRALCLMQLFHGLLVSPLKNAPLTDLQATLDHWRGVTGVDAARMGVVGFCMGGSYALQLAITDQELNAASVFYGQNPRPLEAVAQACPIVGSYPGRDFTAKHARQLEEALTLADVPHDIKIYPDAGHSFFNDRGPAFRPQESADAWGRMLTFFEHYLKTNAA